MPSRVSVILATYDERDNIVPLLRHIRDVLSDRSYEIIVVDDDSPDRTWELVEAEASRDSSIKLIRRFKERGLTSALNTGISASSGDVLVWLDSDFQHPPSKIPELLIEIDQGASVATGSRFLHQQVNDERYQWRQDIPTVIWIHGRLSRLLSLMLCKLSHYQFTDWTSGLIAIRRSIFNDYSLTGYYGECFMSLLFHCFKNNYSVVEIPYTLSLRQRGKSKTSGAGYGRLISLGIRYLIVLTRLIYSGFR